MTKAWTSVALCALCSTCAVVTAFTPLPRAVAEKGLLAPPALQLSTPNSQRRRVRPLGATNDETPEESDDKQNNQTNDSKKFRYSDMNFDKAVRVAKAQAEVDRILNSPDAPFDYESELKKVSSISPGLPPEEQRLEEKVSEVESELYAAIQQQDYELAASKKEEMGKMHVDDCGAVLQVNSAFYKAFSDKDYKAMEDMWLKDNSVLCIHPSHAPLVGNTAVLSSWKSMFESTDGSFQRNWMEPSQIRLVVKGATAIVTCDEEVYARLFVRGKKRQTELINKLTATNIFRKVSGKWYMVYHHASWHSDSDAAKMALKQTPIESSRVRAAGGRIIRPIGDSKDGDAFRPDGMLGFPRFGRLLGGPSDDETPKPAKRVVMTSLSDLLNGGLNDILGSSSGQDDAGGDDDSSSSSNAIIEFSSLHRDEDEDDDEEDGDEDEAVSMIKDWANNQDEPSKLPSSKQKPSSQGNVPKDALRQNCISALRKLCNQGSISPKQKRVLLTDIISCSAKGEFSMVEVAYELLCGEGEDKDAAEEEFADQCRVFALSLPDSPKGQQ